MPQDEFRRVPAGRLAVEHFKAQRTGRSQGHRPQGDRFVDLDGWEGRRPQTVQHSHRLGRGNFRRRGRGLRLGLNRRRLRLRLRLGLGLDRRAAAGAALGGCGPTGGAGLAAAGDGPACCGCGLGASDFAGSDLGGWDLGGWAASSCSCRFSSMNASIGSKWRLTAFVLRSPVATAVGCNFPPDSIATAAPTTRVPAKATPATMAIVCTAGAQPLARRKATPAGRFGRLCFGHIGRRFLHGRRLAALRAPEDAGLPDEEEVFFAAPAAGVGADLSSSCSIADSGTTAFD